MTPKQLKAHRLKHFGTQREMALALGVTTGAVQMWEHERRKIPGIAIKLLACIEAQRIPSSKL